MIIDVEFIGVSRVLSGVSKAEISIPDNGSYRDLIRMLSKTYPKFNGQLIDTEKNTFIGSSMFNLDGKRMVKTDELDNSPEANGHLILMSVLAGG